MASPPGRRLVTAHRFLGGGQAESPARPGSPASRALAECSAERPEGHRAPRSRRDRDTWMRHERTRRFITRIDLATSADTLDLCGPAPAAARGRAAPSPPRLKSPDPDQKGPEACRRTHAREQRQAQGESAGTRPASSSSAKPPALRRRSPVFATALQRQGGGSLTGVPFEAPAPAGRTPRACAILLAPDRAGVCLARPGGRLRPPGHRDRRSARQLLPGRGYAHAARSGPRAWRWPGTGTRTRTRPGRPTRGWRPCAPRRCGR